MRTWSVGASRVVGVLSISDGIQAVPVDNFILDAAEQLLFAVEAPVRSVGLILRPIGFVGCHLDERYAKLPSDIMCCTPLVGGETGRHSHERDNTARAEGARCERQKEG
jgi:hypothetical protein